MPKWRLNKQRLNNPATNQWLDQIQQHGFSLDQAHASLARVIQEQAYMLATNDIALGSIWIFGILIVIVWLAHPIRHEPT
ncbi:MAG: hypothetical protein WB696_16285 [Chthoniobacterales bacterium]